MLHEFLKTVVVQSTTVTPGGAAGPVVVTTTGDKYAFEATAPIKILKWGFLVAFPNNTAVAVVTTGAGAALSLAVRPTPGSDTGRVTVDTLTVPANTTFAIGTGAYRDGFTVSTTSQTPASEPSQAGPVGSTPGTITSGQSQIIVSAGQEVVIAVTTGAATSGSVMLFVEYELLPISKPSGYGTTSAGVVSLTEAYTRLSS